MQVPRMDPNLNSRRDGRSRRNKSYAATHQVLIEAAVRVLAQAIDGVAHDQRKRRSGPTLRV